jgi:hypothetical protein
MRHKWRSKQLKSIVPNKLIIFNSVEALHQAELSPTMVLHFRHCKATGVWPSYVAKVVGTTDLHEWISSVVDVEELCWEGETGAAMVMRMQYLSTVMIAWHLGTNTAATR